MADGFGPAFPWAPMLDSEDLADFLGELSDAAASDDDLSTLQRVENVVSTWRLIATTQHAHNTAPGPGGELHG